MMKVILFTLAALTLLLAFEGGYHVGALRWSAYVDHEIHLGPEGHGWQPPEEWWLGRYERFGKTSRVYKITGSRTLPRGTWGCTYSGEGASWCWPITAPTTPDATK